MIVAPRDFAQYRIEESGETGREWIGELPTLIDNLCAKWGIVADGAPLHGHLGLVIPVRCDDEALVVKVSWMNESNRYEPFARQAWNGDGARPWCHPRLSQ